MKRFIIECSLTCFGRAKRRRRLPWLPSFGPLRINLGCGLAVAPGWVNIDGSLNALIAGWPRPLLRMAYRLSGASAYHTEGEYLGILGSHRFLHHDLAHSLPFVDDVVDNIFTSHFLEHLSRKAGAHMLAESFRVMRPGGLIRISVPDLAHAVKLYQDGDRRKMLEQYFFLDHDWGSYAQHRYMYDFELLREVLMSCGFTSIQRRSYQEGELPDVTVLDNRPGDSLFVEARKPERTTART